MRLNPPSFAYLKFSHKNRNNRIKQTHSSPSLIEYGLTPGNQNVVKLGMVYTQNQWQNDLDKPDVDNEEAEDDTPATRHLTVKASSEIATNTLLWRSKFQIIH